MRKTVFDVTVLCGGEHAVNCMTIARLTIDERIKMATGERKTVLHVQQTVLYVQKTVLYVRTTVLYVRKTVLYVQKTVLFARKTVSHVTALRGGAYAVNWMTMAKLTIDERMKMATGERKKHNCPEHHS